MKKRIHRHIAFLCLLATCATTPAIAGNGIANVAIGSRSLALGGANQATQSDSFSVFSNPAALRNVSEARLDIDQAVSFAARVRHSDRLNESRDTGRQFIPFGNIGYAKPAFDGRGTIGIGFAGVGGAGAFYEDLATGFGNRDRLQGAFGIFTLAPGLAYEVTPGIDIGMSLGLTVAQLDQQVFPDTSNAAGFYGTKLTGATALAPSMRLGATWRATPQLTLGFAWAPKTKIDFKNGELVSNQTALGSGKVTYRNAESIGTNLPEEFGLSASYRASDTTTLMARTTWMRWSRAIGQTRFTARDPTSATTLPILSSTLDQNWRDQLVLAVGIEHMLRDDLSLRFGWNYGRNPIPKIVTSPLNNAVTEHHISAGFGWAVKPGMSIDAVGAYLPRADVKYNSPYSPIGQSARLQVEFIYFGIQSTIGF